ncbi:MAG: beta/gamma crystallin-related protein [Betaproteobacteria bacterium]
MKHWLRHITIAAAIVFAGAAAAQVTIYADENFRGRAVTIDQPVGDFNRYGFNDQASSASVRGGTWQFCTEINFRGRCVSLSPGDYRSLASVGINDRISSLREAGPGGGAGGTGRPRIALYDNNGFGGRGITLEGDVVNLDQIGFNDRANSAVVEEGNWQLCEHAGFQGSCITVAPGRYPDLGGLSGRVSSARMVATAPAPVPPPGRTGGRVILFGRAGLTGQELVIDRPIVRNLGDLYFNDAALSLRVESGYWMFCSEANFEGECRTFGPGDYAELPPELRYTISSGRRINNRYPYRERPNWGGY